MKKEYIGVTICALFLLSYVLDYLAGPFTLTVTNPFLFIQQHLSVYPFTAAGIGIKTLGLLLSMILITLFIEKKYFVRALVVFFTATLFEFYAIQQQATGQQLIPIQWTLALSYTGVLLLLLTGIYIIIGIVLGIYGTFADDDVDSFINRPQTPTHES
jgi:hypothetical protein